MLEQLTVLGNVAESLSYILALTGISMMLFAFRIKFEQCGFFNLPYSQVKLRAGDLGSTAIFGFVLIFVAIASIVFVLQVEITSFRSRYPQHLFQQQLITHSQRFVHYELDLKTLSFSSIPIHLTTISYI